MAKKLTELPSDVLSQAFSSPQTPPDTDRDIYKPKVTLFNGKDKLKGEYTILGQEQVSLDVPELEVSGIKFMTGAGGNLASQLKSLISDLPGGPYLANGRDSSLTIHNRNFNQEPIASFTYFGGNGELLSFHARTTRTEKTLDTASESNIDPDTKELTTTNTQGSSPQTTEGNSQTTDGNANPNAPEYDTVYGKYFFKPPSNGTLDPALLGKKNEPGKKKVIHAKTPKVIEAENKNIARDYKPSEDEVTNYLERCKARYSELKGRVLESGDPQDMLEFLGVNNLPDFTIKRRAWVTKWVQPYKFSDYNSYPEGRTRSPRSGGANQDLYWQWNEGYNYLASNPNIRIIPKHQAKKWDGKGRKPVYELYDQVQIAEYKEIDVPIDGSRILSQVNPNKFSTQNEIRKSIQEEITSTFRIIGRPEIESSKMLEISNVSKKYSGDWYIKKVKHTINSAGYFCDGEAIKKGGTITTTVVVSRTSTKSIYASIVQAAKAKVQMDNAGFNIEKEVEARIEEAKVAERKRGVSNNSESSYQALVTPTSSGDIKISVVRASEDVVNINNTRTEQKNQLKK